MEESPALGESVSTVARRNEVAPKLLFPWPMFMDEGGAMAVGSSKPGIGACEVRTLEERLRDLGSLKLGIAEALVSSTRKINLLGR